MSLGPERSRGLGKGRLLVQDSATGGWLLTHVRPSASVFTCFPDICITSKLMAYTIIGLCLYNQHRPSMYFCNWVIY